MIFKIGLLFHIIGIILIAGGAIGNLVVEKLFWKSLNQPALKFQTLAVVLARFPKIILTGSMLMLASGVLMLYGINWEFIGQNMVNCKIWDICNTAFKWFAYSKTNCGKNCCRSTIAATTNACSVNA